MHALLAVDVWSQEFMLTAVEHGFFRVDLRLCGVGPGGLSEQTLELVADAVVVVAMFTLHAWNR